MARRWIGDVMVKIHLTDKCDAEGRCLYEGFVRVGNYMWHFDDLGAPLIHTKGSGFEKGYDSPGAYDEMASSVVSFASYYTSDNRSEDSEGFPEAEVADAINEATQAWKYEDGEYLVKRSKNGKARRVR